MKIAIIDYGMGNLKSLKGAFQQIGIEDIETTKDPQCIREADKLILPGVGAFKLAMENIKKFNLDSIIRENVLDRKKPILGICLGMQLLTQSSEEGGSTKGLNLVPGNVIKFKKGKFPIPHIGFNQVKPNIKSKLYLSFNYELIDFYFVHSYKVTSTKDINQGISNYMENFISSFELGNIAGVQFHPELSQKNGLKLLSNFIQYVNA